MGLSQCEGCIHDSKGLFEYPCRVCKRINSFKDHYTTLEDKEVNME